MALQQTRVGTPSDSARVERAGRRRGRVERGKGHDGGGGDGSGGHLGVGGWVNVVGMHDGLVPRVSRVAGVGARTPWASAAGGHLRALHVCVGMLALATCTPPTGNTAARTPSVDELTQGTTSSSYSSTCSNGIAGGNRRGRGNARKQQRTRQQCRASFLAALLRVCATGPLRPPAHTHHPVATPPQQQEGVRGAPQHAAVSPEARARADRVWHVCDGVGACVGRAPARLQMPRTWWSAWWWSSS